jgi:hypothetical protein
VEPEGSKDEETISKDKKTLECEDKMHSSNQKVMKITDCPHTSRKHYAKNMCSSCYRKYGRNQNAWNCAHKERLLYSMGMC